MMRDRPAIQVWLTLLEPGGAEDFDDVARAVAWVASEQADYVVGSR